MGRVGTACVLSGRCGHICGKYLLGRLTLTPPKSFHRVLLNLAVVFGTGLSEIVRAAYGFLANNYDDGDKIYIFGFSRGAYIARSIAGLVADHGLLTKRGMDNFHAVYETFYKYDRDPAPDSIYADIRKRKPAKITAQGGGDISTTDAGLRPVPPHTVEVVGVFDTVA